MLMILFVSEEYFCKRAVGTCKLTIGECERQLNVLELR